MCTACVVLASLPGSTLDLAHDQFSILQADLHFGFATNNFQLLFADPKNEQAKTNLYYFRAERLKRDSLTENSEKSLKNEINNKGQFSFTYERLCRGETRKASGEKRAHTGGRF